MKQWPGFYYHKASSIFLMQFLHQSHTVNHSLQNTLPLYREQSQINECHCSIFFSQTITVLTQMKTSCIQTIRVFTTVSHCQACSTSHCHVVHVNFKTNEILQFYYT